MNTRGSPSFAGFFKAYLHPRNIQKSSLTTKPIQKRASYVLPRLRPGAHRAPELPAAIQGKYALVSGCLLFFLGALCFEEDREPAGHHPGHAPHICQGAT